MTPVQVHRVAVDSRAGRLELSYREGGSGPPVLLLHGWPTSSFLWRNVMPPMTATSRVIALDLPGFGDSDKPKGVRYSYPFYGEVLSAFADALELDTLGLAVHDLGGPVGVWWALQNQARIAKLALLNTLLYPELSWAVVAFGAGLRLPGVRSYLTSPRGLALAMRIGISRRERVTAEVLRGVQAPFETRAARRALVATALGLSPKGLQEIGRRLGELACPVRVLYGERDRILPDVAKTMARVARDLPQAEITALPDCGHFLQEEQPEEIGTLLATFFA